MKRVPGVCIAVLGFATVVAACGSSGEKLTATPPTDRSTVLSQSTTTTLPKPVTKTVGKTVEYGGFAMTVVEATFTATPTPSYATTTTQSGKAAANPGTLDLSMSVQNLTPESLNPQGEYSVETKGASLAPGSLSDLPEVPGDGKAPGKLTLSVTDFSFDDAVITFGAATEHQAKVPLGNTGDLVTYEDTTQPITGSATSGVVTIAVSKALTQSYGPARSSHKQAAKGQVYLSIEASVTTTQKYGLSFSDGNVSLTGPDGTASVPVQALSSNGGCCEVITNLAPMKWTFTFAVTEPHAGKYTLFAIDGSQPKGSIAFTLP